MANVSPRGLHWRKTSEVWTRGCPWRSPFETIHSPFFLVFLSSLQKTAFFSQSHSTYERSWPRMTFTFNKVPWRKFWQTGKKKGMQQQNANQQYQEAKDNERKGLSKKERVEEMEREWKKKKKTEERNLQVAIHIFFVQNKRRTCNKKNIKQFKIWLGT